MQELTIEAQHRTQLGKLNKKVRAAGKLPGVLYGSASSAAADSEGKAASVNLEVSAKQFDKIYRQAGENTLINLVVDGKSKKVLIHDVAKHFMKNEIIHVDFYEVDLTRKIHAKIPVEILGVAPAVKELGGVLIKNMSEIEVEAKPQDLPRTIRINIETLKTFENSIRISDVSVGDKVKILGHGEDVVVAVQPPRSDKEIEDLAQPTAEAEKATIEAMNKESAAAEEKVEEGAEKAQVKAEKEEKKEEKKETKAKSDLAKAEK